MNINTLKQAGIEYDKGLKRCMGDAELYELVLVSFLDEDLLHKSNEAYETKDYKSLYECAHNIKGLSGNTDMTELYETSSALSALLKYADAPDAEVLSDLYTAMCMAYQRTYDAIERAMGD